MIGLQETMTIGYVQPFRISERDGRTDGRSDGQRIIAISISRDKTNRNSCMRFIKMVPFLVFISMFSHCLSTANLSIVYC